MPALATIVAWVLIVEDEPDIARLVREHLADVGCDAVVAADAAQARARFAAGDLDLVVLESRPSSTASSASRSAPTTTWSSRSASPSCRRA
jgi:DNA-binding NtrC family response regulator